MIFQQTICDSRGIVFFFQSKGFFHVPKEKLGLLSVKSTISGNQIFSKNFVFSWERTMIISSTETKGNKKMSLFSKKLTVSGNQMFSKKQIETIRKLFF